MEYEQLLMSMHCCLMEYGVDVNDSIILLVNAVLCGNYS